MNMLISRFAILASVMRFKGGIVLRIEERKERREQLEQFAACTLCAGKVFCLPRAERITHSRVARLHCTRFSLLYAFALIVYGKLARAFQCKPCLRKLFFLRSDPLL